MDSAETLQLAQKTCAQCKASKKKCDKLFPTCSRCSRLFIDCVYLNTDESAGAVAAHNAEDPRFDEVFQRLRTIETHIFATPPNTNRAIPSKGASQKSSVAFGYNGTATESSPLDCNLLGTPHMGNLLQHSLRRVLDESQTTIKAIVRDYLRRVNRWLLLFPSTKFDLIHSNFDALMSNEECSILILAMHLLVTPIDEHPASNNLTESPWYRACKYHFGQYAVLREPFISLVQAGLLIALFEHLHCVENRALTTLGICTSLANALELNTQISGPVDTSQGYISEEREEAMLTWWGLMRLERYFNMPPTIIPKQPNASHSQKSGPPMRSMATLDTSSGENCIIEVEAAAGLGQVQALIRNNYQETSQDWLDTARNRFNEIDRYQAILNIRSRQTRSTAGIAVSSSALLQLQSYMSETLGTLSYHNDLVLLHSLLDRMRVATNHCKCLDEDYSEVVQPYWISMAYQGICTYRVIRSLDAGRSLPEMNMDKFYEILQSLKSQYKFAAYCLNRLESLST